MPKNIKVSIVGATGYAGGEVARLILEHPGCEIEHLTAGASAGSLMVEHHPELHQLHAREIEPTSVKLIKSSDVIFLALPHGTSGEITNELESAGFEGIVLDIGADHRLERESDWDAYYGGAFQKPYIYGLPELKSAAKHQRRLLKTARRIAVPGCNVTAVTLALQPLAAAGLIDLEDIVVTLVNGYSGAGKSGKTHLLAAEAIENAKPYSAGGTHRHIPEIRQNLAKIAGVKDFSAIKISLTPTLAPMVRGILASISVKPSKQFASVSSDSLQEIFEQFYATEQFVETLPQGVNVSTAAVSKTNFCHLQVTFDQAAGRICVLSAIDNLVRGTAGQAIQSMNLALGLPEQEGIVI